MKTTQFLSIFVCTSLFAIPEKSVEKAFTEIYETGGWEYNEEGKPFSGRGSTKGNTEFYIQFLQEFMKTHRIESVLDVGCGDWTFSKYIDWGTIRYTGTDVVRSVIDENNKKFRSPTVEFFHGDALEIDLPAADLLICKDVLMHLPISDIERFLRKIEGFTHCLFVNNVDDRTLTAENRDIERGEFRNLDLTKFPFLLDGTILLNYSTDHCVKQVLYVQRKN